MHRIELVMVRKSFHSKVDLGLYSLFEVAYDVGRECADLNCSYQCVYERFEAVPL